MVNGRVFWAAATVAVFGLAVGAARSKGPTDLVVHEWGTFLAMSGSDGITLEGMYHEEHALPSFVHARSKDQLRIPSVITKGETPVIYFYTRDRQDVNVRVGFPTGIWTQWYPQASTVGPAFQATGSAIEPKDGHIEWDAEVIPADGPPVPGMPTTAKDALWNYARDVDAAYVRTVDHTDGGTRSDVDRFLFYRGLGRAPMPVSFRADGGGTLEYARGTLPEVRHVFILRVENGKAAYRYLPALTPGQSVSAVIPSMKDAVPMADFTRRISDDLAGRLAEAGLYPKEARAMVNTWRASYFHTDGIRALCVLPQAWTDRYIPMRLTPEPRQLVRVMVGRVELLTPERERRAEEAVKDLGASDAPARERAFANLREQGRYVEPVVRRVLATARDEMTRILCSRLLLTDFVTSLRSAVNDATTGRRIERGPSGGKNAVLFARAQLAGLLHEIGRDAEARAEARPVLEALRQLPAPRMDDHAARHYLRAYARAVEGTGDNVEAAARYERFVRFGSQEKKCNGCHETEGPRNMAWFKDWWAGRKYARYARLTGRAEMDVTENEKAVARNPNDVAARMLLAYLYEGQGKPDRAEQMWAAITGSRTRTASER